MRKDNRGSALLMVIIAMCFIGILGSLMLSLTVTNIQMKQVDLQSKTNFYQSETVIEELKAGLEKISSDCMYVAYNHILLNYVEITTSGSKTIKGEFDKKYIETLIAVLGYGDEPVSYNSSDSYEYDPEVLRNMISTSPESFINTNNHYGVSNPIKIRLDINDSSSVNSITLKDIIVKYTDSIDFETIIMTDICMEAPNLNFDSASIYPEFTKYALIADRKLSVNNNPTGLNINGNIYVGAGGVSVLGDLKIESDMLITRGDIIVEDSSSLEIGSESNLANIWAENIATKGNLSGIKSCNLTIYGNCRVSDDLTLGAKRSKVTIGGTYYGYTYNKMLEESVSANPSNLSKSSAILINGLNSSLNMEHLKSLIIAGNAFISRKAEIAGTPGASDIRMGESITVKSNQLAYLIPNEYITGGQNPMSQGEIIALNGADVIDFSSAPSELTDLLTTKGYAEYHYNISGTSIVYYYFEFKDQQSANIYFERYFNDSENKNNMTANAKTYFMDGGSEITLNNNLILAAHGMKKNTDENASEDYILSGGVLPDMNNINENLYNDAKNTAKEYVSRQLSLIETTRNTIGDIRLEDKNANPLFKTIISHKNNGTSGEAISVIEKEALESTYGFKTLSDDTRVKPIGIDLSGDGNYDCFVYFVYNPTKEFQLADFVLDSVSYPMKKGIVVATGDVNVAADYKGLIISGGTIDLESNNIMIQSNPSMVQEILTYALDMEGTSWIDETTKKFTHYFTAYSAGNSGAGEKIDQVDISKYITFENWKKN